MKEFSLNYPGGVAIARGLTEQALVAAVPNAKKRDMNTGWVWYSFPALSDEGMVVGISLAFFNGTLREMSCAHSDSALYGSSWNEWSREKEELRVRNTTAWLKKKGYSLGTFPWGQVWASFDEKGGFGSGGVRYS